MVSPDRLRFDFSHHEAPTRAQLDEVERLANLEVLGDTPVRHDETTKDARPSSARSRSSATSTVTSCACSRRGRTRSSCAAARTCTRWASSVRSRSCREGSIGSNLRRIEALTGTGALDRIAEEEAQLRGLADTLKVTPGELPDRVAKLLDQVKDLERALAAERAKQAAGEATELAAAAADGIVVVRHATA